MADELEEGLIPTEQELEAAVNPAPEPMMDMSAPEAAPADKHEITFDDNGKLTFQAEGGEVQATKEELIKYAQQGYGATNKIGELNKQLEESKALHAPEGADQYRETDEWAKANPDQWQKILDQVQGEQAPAPQMNPEMQEALAPLMQELQGLREFQQTVEAERLQNQTQSQDHALDTEIKSIRDSYPDLDFDKPNDDGKSLEYRVMEHAADKGITSFSTAFKDLQHESLIKAAEERGKEQVIAERRNRNKLGLLDVQAPTSEVPTNPDYNPRTATDSQNFEAALAELKQG